MTLQVNSTAVNDVYLNRNVGYTIVGSPTISDGVISGFSSSDYLSLQKLIPTTSDIELNIDTDITDLTSGTSILLAGSYSYQGAIIGPQNSNKFSFLVYDGGLQTLTTNYVFSQTGRYIINFKLKNGNYFLKIYKSNELVANESGTFNYSLRYDTFTIGARSDWNYLKGSINFNNTYIKVNGVTWFNGKQQASPTINALQINGNTVWQR